MSAGYNLPKGSLTRNNIAISEYWAFFNHFFSSSSRNTTSYKFGLLKSILDNLLSVEGTARGMELTYDNLFSKFAENYWNLVAKYHIHQMRFNGKSNISKLEQIIESVLSHSAIIGEIEFENLSTKDKNTVITQVKQACSRNVIGALYDDFDGCLYGFDKKERAIWIHNGAYQFLLAYKVEIEQLNYYAWAKFLENVNEEDLTKQLLQKLECATPQRKNLTIYRDILRAEFENNNCYYCGCKLGINTHVDHVLPWHSFYLLFL